MKTFKDISIADTVMPLPMVEKLKSDHAAEISALEQAAKDSAAALEQLKQREAKMEAMLLDLADRLDALNKDLEMKTAALDALQDVNNNNREQLELAARTQKEQADWLAQQAATIDALKFQLAEAQQTNSELVALAPPPQANIEELMTHLLTPMHDQITGLKRQIQVDRARRAGTSMRVGTPDVVAAASADARRQEYTSSNTDTVRQSIRKALAELRDK